MTTSPPKKPTPPRIGQGLVKGLALVIDWPLYLLIAWAIHHWGGDTPAFPEHSAFAIFAIFAAASLGAAVASLRHPRLLPASARSDGPALAGVLFFAGYRQWTGFLILWGITGLCFLALSLRRFADTAPTLFSRDHDEE